MTPGSTRPRRPDSDQFIYKFAGASDRWLEAFVNDFGAERHELVENFRCAQAIVDVANRLVANQHGRVHKGVMAPAKAAPGAVHARSYADETEEARGVADWVEGLLRDGLEPGILHESEVPDVAPDEICVLCRTRYSLDRVIAEFRDRKIEYLFSTGRRLVETREGQLVLQGLKVVQSPADRVTKESILAAWSETLLDSGAAELDVPTFLIRLAEESAEARPYAEILQSSTSREVGDLVRALVGAVEGAADAARASEPDRASALAGDVDTLSERWKQYSGHTTPSSRSIGGFLGEIALAGKSVIEGPGVRVLTVHVAKGLEFKAVALVGMNEGTLPDFRNVSRKSDLADERRVAYVAVTRASRLLLLTRPRIRMMPWGDSRVQQESRFVSDMGLRMDAR